MRSIPWFALAVLASGCDRSTPPADRWPTAGWATATPAEVGLDSAVLAELDQEFRDGKHHFVDEMLVIRRGRLAYRAQYRHDYRAAYGVRDTVSHQYNYYDANWHPFYQGTTLHTLQSASKSITSMVFGVARALGHFGTIDTAMLAFFPTRKIANLDDRKRAITVRHLLTMTAGLDWDETSFEYTDPRNNCAVMERSQDWVQYVLDRPMATQPGDSFVYNSGATELLAEIFKQATGQDIAEYAAAHLFKPLGITDFHWKRTPLGLPDTEGGVYLTAPDLAKLGYLFLKGGQWEGNQLIAADWITQSVTPAKDPGARLPGFKYGLKWWLLPYGDQGKLAWAMMGYGGQYLIVVPEHELIAVFTGWNIDEHPGVSPRDMLARLVGAVRNGGR
ncbi:MAG: serine hydrolase domain-containing protein [Gemmatimonadales bacterium]